MLGYCEGCNERFPVDQASQRCPVCSAPLKEAPSDPITASTAELERDRNRDQRRGVTAEQLLWGERPDLSGRVVGKYEIEALVGRGGMSQVYRARHLTLERTCALKVLAARTPEEEVDWTRRFLREARSAAGLVHPNIVTVHDIDHLDDLHFIEMEYVEGPTLSDFVRQKGQLDPLHAGRCLREIAGALAHAHGRGLVHRDVKPSNVLMLDGLAKLTDFGLARPLVTTKDTPGHAIAGTPYFMAPELFDGAPPTPRSDVYAAGVTLYFLLTGRLPFQAESLQDLISQHHQLSPPDPRRLREDIPQPMVELMERCLAKVPESRFADARELHDALQVLLGRLRSLEELVDAALEGEALHWAVSATGIEVSVPLPEGRGQRVLIEELVSDLDGEELVRISSPCAPLSAEYCQRALELNAESHHGAIAIHEVGGALHFVARSSYPRATCDPEEVRRSVYSIAHLADRIEHTLTGEDRH